MSRLAFGLMLLALGACHRAPPADDGINAAQAADLDNAAEMLDVSPDGLAAPPEGSAAPVNGD